MKWHRVTGIIACSLLIISCFMHWTWYPDIQKYFTGFFSEHNYYGRPGILLSFFAGTGILFYLLKKAWSDRLNLIFSALAVAYAITSFLRFSSSYDGFVPQKQAGIYLMLVCAFAHVILAVLLMSIEKTAVPIQEDPAV